MKPEEGCIHPMPGGHDCPAPLAPGAEVCLTHLQQEIHGHILDAWSSLDAAWKLAKPYPLSVEIEECFTQLVAVRRRFEPLFNQPAALPEELEP